MDVTELPRLIEEREVQVLNAEFPIDWICPPPVTETRPVHRSNAFAEMDVTASVRVTDVTDVNLLTHPFTVAQSKVASVKAVQPSKIYDPSVEGDDWMVTDDKDVQP